MTPEFSKPVGRLSCAHTHTHTHKRTHQIIPRTQTYYWCLCSFCCSNPQTHPLLLQSKNAARARARTHTHTHKYPCWVEHAVMRAILALICGPIRVPVHIPRRAESDARDRFVCKDHGVPVALCVWVVGLQLRLVSLLREIKSNACQQLVKNVSS